MTGGSTAVDTVPLVSMAWGGVDGEGGESYDSQPILTSPDCQNMTAALYLKITAHDRRLQLAIGLGSYLLCSFKHPNVHLLAYC